MCFICSLYSLEIGISFVHILYYIKRIFFIILGLILFKALLNLYNVPEKNNFVFHRAIRFYQDSEDWIYEIKLQSGRNKNKAIKNILESLISDYYYLNH